MPFFAAVYKQNITYKVKPEHCLLTTTDIIIKSFRYYQSFLIFIYLHPIAIAIVRVGNITMIVLEL